MVDTLIVAVVAGGSAFVGTLGGLYLGVPAFARATSEAFSAAIKDDAKRFDEECERAATKIVDAIVDSRKAGA